MYCTLCPHFLSGAPAGAVRPLGDCPAREENRRKADFLPRGARYLGAVPKYRRRRPVRPIKKSRTSRKSRRAKKALEQTKIVLFLLFAASLENPRRKTNSDDYFVFGKQDKKPAAYQKFFKTATRALPPLLIFEIPTPPERPRLAAYRRRRNILFRQLCRFFDVSKNGKVQARPFGRRGISKSTQNAKFRARKRKIRRIDPVSTFHLKNRILPFLKPKNADNPPKLRQQ